MDDFKFKSKLMTYVISKLMKKTIQNKFGYQVDIQLNEVSAVYINGRAHLHLDVDADIDQKDLEKILDDVGLKD